MYTYVYICSHTDTHAGTQVHMQACLHTHMYTHLHTHAHTRITDLMHDVIRSVISVTETVATYQLREASLSYSRQHWARILTAPFDLYGIVY